MPTLPAKSRLFLTSPRVYAWFPAKFCIVTLLCGAATSCVSAQTFSPSDQADRIQGTVINTANHEPITHALVYSQDNRLATFTDDRGRFDLPFPELDPAPVPDVGGRIHTHRTFSIQQGPIVLRARKPGFLPGSDGQVAVVVDPAQPNVVIGLVPEALIVGRVVLPGSGDAADYSDLGPIQISLLRRTFNEGHERWDQQNFATARSNGEFRFFNLPAGTYKLMTNEMLDRDPSHFIPGTQQWGFPPVFFPSASDADSATSIRLSAGQTFQASLTLERREYYEVRLPVINAPENTRFEVFVWPIAHPGPGYSLGFDRRRKTIRGSLPNGTYSILLTGFAGNGGSGMATFTIHGGNVTSPSIAIVPNPSISIVIHEEFSKSLDQQSSRTIGSRAFGRAHSQTYQPILIPIDAYGAQRPVQAGVTSSADHNYYAFDQVPPGRYRVKIYGGSPYAASIRAGTTDLLREPLVVALGSAPPEIDVVMRDDGASVTGELVAPAEKEGERTRLSGSVPHPVYFLPVDGNGAFTTAWTSPDGKFAAQNLPPGTYNVVGFDRQQPDLEQEGEANVHDYQSQSQQITVSANQAPRLRVPMIVVPE